MAHLTTSVEYGVHCLLLLAEAGPSPVSGKELAEFQGISPSFASKIFQKLEKVGIVVANEGARGGYMLAKDPGDITILDIVDAIEGNKPLFECKEVRTRCVLFSGNPPGWATGGVCAVHAVMLQAERAMRDALSSKTLADLGAKFGQAAPASFGNEMRQWFRARLDERRAARGSGINVNSGAQV